MLDSGADINCVSERICRKLELEVEHHSGIVISGLGGGPSKYQRMCEIEVIIQGMKSSENVWAVVVEDEAIPACVLLGTQFLHRSGIVMDYGRRTYRFSGGESYPFSIVENSRKDTAWNIPNVWTVCNLKHETDPNGREGAKNEKIEEKQEGDHSKKCQNDVRAISLDGIGELIRSEYDWKIIQDSCPVLKRVVFLIKGRSDDWSGEASRFKRYRKELFLQRGILMFDRNNPRPVVSFPVLVELALTLHNEMAHLGREKLIRLMQQHLWHPSIYKCASDITNTCDLCQRGKVSSTQAPPVARIITSSPFDLFAVDVVKLPKCGPFVGCLVGIDHFTKWLTAVPLTCLTGEHLASQLEKKVLPNLVRTPAKILSDNGPEFRSGSFGEVLKIYGIQQQFTTPYRPQGNGITERANRTLLELLRLEGAGDRNWVKLLPKVLMVYNNSYQSSIGCSPSDFILRKNHAHKDRALVDRSLEKHWRSGQGHKSFEPYEKGDLVLKKVILQGRETTGKFENKFRGPFEIVKVNANQVTYLLKHHVTKNEIRAHHAQLRRYRLPPLYIQNSKYYGSKVTVRSNTQYEESDEELDIPVGFGGGVGDASASSSGGQRRSYRTGSGSLSQRIRERGSDTDLDRSCRFEDGLNRRTQKTLGDRSNGAMLQNQHSGYGKRGRYFEPGLRSVHKCNRGLRLTSSDDQADSENVDIAESSLGEQARSEPRRFREVESRAIKPKFVEGLGYGNLWIEKGTKGDTVRVSPGEPNFELLTRQLGGEAQEVTHSRGDRSAKPIFRSPIQTRSRGPVKKFEKVQNRILEYKRRGRRKQEKKSRAIREPPTEMPLSGEE